MSFGFLKSTERSGVHICGYGHVVSSDRCNYLIS
jgi:hypothetical protein